MADQQRLNSLDRFRKTSTRLVLEEHGHCEVPAGCGGVVLRWRDPHASRLFRISVYTGGTREVWINGKLIGNYLSDFPVGRVVVAIHVPTFVGKKKSVLAFAAVPFESKDTGVIEPKFAVITSSSSRWAYTLTEPKSDAWKLPGMDDSSWSTMVQAVAPKLGHGDEGWYDMHRASEAKAQCMTVRESWNKPQEVWIRHEFEVPVPETSS